MLSRNTSFALRRRRTLRSLGLGVALAFALCASSLGAAPREVTYRVAPGDTLSGIAARHRLSVAELCARNSLPRDGVLRPGQALRVPGKVASPGKIPTKTEPAPRSSAKTEAAPRAAVAKTRSKAPEAPPLAEPKSARSRPTQTPGKVAAEVPGSLPAAPVGGFGKTKLGSDAAVCGSTGKSASFAKCAPEGKASAVGAGDRRTQTPSRPAPSWLAYSARPDKPGYLRLQSTAGRWSGQAVVGGWQIPEDARVGIAHALASWRSGAEERIHGRLIRLLARISDQFGGRPIRIVSGYRPHAEARFTPHSKHTLGRAVDFSIPGVPNAVLRDYLRATFKDVGVGYYPNSTHVHLDIREEDTYWVDYSAPGQAPAYGGPRRPKAFAVGTQRVTGGVPSAPRGATAAQSAPPLVPGPAAPPAAPQPAGVPGVAPSVPPRAVPPVAAVSATAPSASPDPAPAPSETKETGAGGAGAPPTHDTHTPEDP